MSKQKWKPRDIEKWKVQVLTLCGMTISDIERDSRCSLTRGAINRVVTDSKIGTCRQWSLEVRARKLLALEALAADQPVSGFVRKTVNDIGTSAASAISKGHAGLIKDRGVKEICAMRDLPKALSALGGPVHTPENTTVEFQAKRSTVTRNIANCPLEWFLAHSKIEQWMYDAALKYRNDCQRVSIGNLSSSGVGSELVDGGRDKSSISDGAADALETLAEVTEAIKVAFIERDLPARDSITLALRYYAVEGHRSGLINRNDRPAFLNGFKEGMSAVAWVYGMAPSNEVTKHLDRVSQSRGGKLRQRVKENN